MTLKDVLTDTRYQDGASLDQIVLLPKPFELIEVLRWDLAALEVSFVQNLNIVNVEG